MTKRNYGIDCLRLLSMFFVIILHTLGKGGVLSKATPGTGMYAAAWYLEIAAFCAVDIFAIISGYVNYNEPAGKTRLSSYIMLWLQVVFWGAAAAFAFWLVRPELVPLSSITEMLFPVANDLYWYFTAFTGLFVIKPLLDAAVASCSMSTARKAFVAIIVVFGCFELVFQCFYLSRGYSFAWISLLYLLGAILKKCDIGRWISPLVGIVGILVLCTGTWIFTLLRSDLLVSYTSPTILGTAILYVIVFSRLTLGDRMKKIIAFAAPGAFSAYILNCQRDVWKYLMKDRFLFLLDKPVISMVLVTLAFALLFLTASVLLDHVRRRLFKLLHVRDAVDAVEKAAESCVGFIADRL